MIENIIPKTVGFEENIDSLKYANRSKNINSKQKENR